MNTPNEILNNINKKELSKGKGKLKIFFGMSAGVGKTYSMLLYAKELMKSGFSVKVGYIETHGRQETADLLNGLELIPQKKIDYKGIEIEEFDLEKAIELKPDYILVDELAHSNIQSMKHPKRYQDVLDLLENGINVLTTLNVQHIESRSKTVEQITGVKINETVPDSIVEIAEIVELIDLPIEELLQRLKDGKVYVPEKAKTAFQNFFKTGNLISLREMALRFTAEKVESDLVNYMSERNIPGPWKAGDKLMVALGPSPFSAELVRWTRRMAYALKTHWYAVYVKTGIKETEKQLEQLENNLRLAKELGAEVITTADTDLVNGLLQFARKNNVSQIIIGKPARYNLLNYFMKDNYVDRLIAESGNIDIYIIRPNQIKQEAVKNKTKFIFETTSKEYIFACLSVLLVSFVCYPFTKYIGYQSIGLIQLLNLLIIPFYAGRGAIIASAILNTLIWNFFYIPPLFTFEIGKLHDVLTLMLNFFIAISAGFLVSRIRKQQALVNVREKNSLALLNYTKELSNCTSKYAAINIALNHIEFHTSSSVTFFDDNSEPIISSEELFSFNNKETAIVKWVLENNKVGGKYTNNLPDSIGMFFPVISKKSKIGVICILLKNKLMIEEENLIINIIEQLISVYEKEEAEEKIKQLTIDTETKRLYDTLFDSISHEFRTPIAIIAGSSTSLLENNIAQNTGLVQNLANEIYIASKRLDLLVENFLDITRLEHGKLNLNLEVYDLKDIINDVLISLKEKSKNYNVQIEYQASNHRILADYTLIAQAFFNILHNEFTYTPDGTNIKITTYNKNNELCVSISDNGSGLSDENLEHLFEKFYRVKGTKAGGTGLGLSISKGFIEAHKGNIIVKKNIPNGLIFNIILPLYE